MTESLDEILDSLFHGCAVVAFVEQAILSGMAPELKATKWRAYQIYEEALAAKNAAHRTIRARFLSPKP